MIVPAALLAATLVARRFPLALAAWLERRALRRQGFSRTFLDSAAGRMTVFEAGSGPPLVFLHGAGDQAGAWSKVAPAFTSRYRVLIPDLPGHGSSAPARGPLTMAMELAGVEALLDLCGAKQGAVLVGNSLGAWLAMLYAAGHAERVSRIVLVNGGPLRWTHSGVTLLPADREEARRTMEALRDPGSPRVPDFVLDDVIRTARDGPIGRLAAAPDLDEHLLDGRLSECRVRAELLWGESDRLMGLDYARNLANQLPDARLTVVPRCGHIPQRERPREFGAALASILSESAG